MELDEFTVSGTSKRKLNTSFLPLQTKIDTNNLNLDTSGLRSLSYTTRPYTGVTLNYLSMLPQQNKIDTNSLNLNTNGLKPVKPRFTPEQVKNAGLSQLSFSVYKKNGEKYGNDYGYESTGGHILGSEALLRGMFDNKDYWLRFPRSINNNDELDPGKKANEELMYEYPEHMAKVLNGESLPKNEVDNLNEAFPNNTSYKPGNNWNYNNTKSYLEQLYPNNSSVNDKTINTVMDLLNNPKIENTLNNYSWNKIKNGSDLFLTNYNAAEAFKKRIANGTAFKRPISVKAGIKLNYNN